MNIALSRIHFPVTQLGPGKRVGIWFQGCSIRCTGCVSVDTWAEGKSQVSLEDVFQLLEQWLVDADGVTISGGEPFDQLHALEAVLDFIKANGTYDILVYSGYSLEYLTRKAKRVLTKIDVLITDPFDETATQSKQLVGSDNQRMHLLTETGGQRFSDYADSIIPQTKTIDTMFSNKEVWMAGVPGQYDLPTLKKQLESQGHELKHTQGDRVVKGTNND